MSEALGNHILVEFSGCSPDILNNVSEIESAMVAAAEKAGATVINSTFHHFSPYGVSGVVVIQESHLAIHSWPEYGYAAVDLFTCGEQVDPWVSFDFLKEAFKSTNHSAIELKRGAIKLLQRLDFDLTTMREQAQDRQNPQKFTRNVWFTDKDDDQALSLRHTGEVLYDKQSPYQRVRVLDTYKYGKMLTLDNMVMTTEKDEYCYHEMIAHPAVFAHGNVKNVLVIGAGDGGTIRELCRHEKIESITMVEIDGSVIEACKTHLPDIASAFDDPRVDLKIEDGIAYVKNVSQSFDLILVDGSDPVGPAEGLFSKSFYQDCFAALSKRGILVAQGESPRFNEKAFVGTYQTIQETFGDDRAAISLFFVPTYPTGMWSFQWGLKGETATQMKSNLEVDLFVKKHNLQYYNAQIHQASFAMPGFVKEMINTPAHV